MPGDRRPAQGGIRPPTTHVAEMEVYACTPPKSGYEYRTTERKEAEWFQQQFNTTTCVQSLELVTLNTWMCKYEPDLDVCSGAQVDWQVIDPLLRPDCEAGRVRNMIAFLGPEETSRVISSECAGGEDKDEARLLQAQAYDDSCPGGTARHFQGYMQVYQNQCDTSWQWNLHSNAGTVLRGLAFDPPLNSFMNVVPCNDYTCTSDTSKSCWPRPRFGDGSAWGSTTGKIFTCANNSGDTDWHFSGNFRGTLYFHGNISYAGSGSCQATDLGNSLIRLQSLSLATCNIWTDEWPSYSDVPDTSVERNVCI